MFILLLRASMMQKTSKDHNSQMVSSLEQPLLHTKYQFLKMVRVSATGMFSLTFKVGNLECKKGQLIGDENWDKFEDEGISNSFHIGLSGHFASVSFSQEVFDAGSVSFTFVKELTLNVENVVALPNQNPLRLLIKHLPQKEFLSKLKEPIPVTQLVRETAAVMQEFTQLGCICLIDGLDDGSNDEYEPNSSSDDDDGDG
ncbi:unnamed protein product [Camellia sinensis]